MNRIISLTLAGGKPLLVRLDCVIAAHDVVRGEADARANTQIYLSNGAKLFVRESADDVMFYQDQGE